jgi:hypothetical protein
MFDVIVVTASVAVLGAQVQSARARARARINACVRRSVLCVGVCTDTLERLSTNTPYKLLQCHPLHLTAALPPSSLLSSLPSASPNPHDHSKIRISLQTKPRLNQLFIAFYI